MMLDILVIDDDIEDFKPGLMQALRGNRLHFASSGSKGLETLENENIKVVLLDIKMPPEFAQTEEREGVEVLKCIQAEYPDIPVIMLTVLNEIDLIIETIQEGAFHYILKPLDRDKLRDAVARATETGVLRTKVERMSQQRDAAIQIHTGRKKKRNNFHGMIGRHPLMLELYEQIERLESFPDFNVVILGERGTGKELVARAIHDTSPRKDAEFKSVNCAGLADSVLESELFGHVKGAFTGAEEARKGMFRSADKGTLFLDEVGDMTEAVQAKVLRAIEYGEVTPVGSDKAEHVDVRIVCATNKDLTKMRDEGTFREDLYDRIWDIPLYIPPLRRRKSDVPAIARSFLKNYSDDADQDYTLDDSAISVLTAYEWPGNIRELRRVLRQALVNADDTLLNTNIVCKILGIEPPEKSDESETPEADTEVEEFEDVDDPREDGGFDDDIPEIQDLAEFKRIHGEMRLKEVLEMAIRKGGNARGAMILLGYPQDRFDAFRKRLQRLGLKVRELKDS